MARKIYINNNNPFQIKKAYFNNNSSISTLSKGYANLSGNVFQFFPSYTWLKYSVNQYWTQVQHLSKTNVSTTLSLKIHFTNSQIGQTFGIKAYTGKYSRYNEIVLDSSTRIFSRQNYKNIGFMIYEFPITSAFIESRFYQWEMGYLSLLVLSGEALQSIGSELTDYFGWNFNAGEHHWCFAFDSVNGYYNSLTLYRSDKKQEKGSLIGTVESSSSNTYPENGIGTDGYWYVRQT